MGNLSGGTSQAATTPSKTLNVFGPTNTISGMAVSTPGTRLFSSCTAGTAGTSGTDGDADVFEDGDRATGTLKWTAMCVDLVFCSNSQLRALAEVYASPNSQQKFVHDVVTTWNQMMNLGHLDIT